MASEEFRIVEAIPAVAPPPTIFSADADVVIRIAGSRDLHAHKLILSLVSPFFKDTFMFAIPQSPIDTLGTLPRVDVDESAETWEHILLTIYPVPCPIIDNLDDLESLLTAVKYEMQPVIDVHKKSLENRAFIREDPLRLYALACACGLADQAKCVAKNAELSTITERSDAADLRGLTVESYHSLVSFLARRDSQWHQFLGKLQTPNSHQCHCHKPHVEALYDSIKESLKAASFSIEEVYLKALEDRSQYHQMGCPEVNCSVSNPEIKAFIERVAKEREDLCSKFIPGTSVPDPIVAYSKVPRRELDLIQSWNGPVSLSLTVALCSCIILFVGKRAKYFF